MTDIESKMKLFSKVIYEKIERKNESKIKEFEKQREEILRKKNLEIKNKEEVALKEIEKKVNIKYAEKVSKEKIKSKQEILQLKEHFIEETVKSLEEKLKEFCTNEEYKKYLFDKLSKTLTAIEQGSYSIHLLPRDIQKFQKELNEEIKKHTNLNITIQKNDKDIIGGFLIVNGNGKYRIDNTLTSKLLDNRQYIGLKVIDIME